MRTPRIFHSVRYKISLGAVLLLVPILGAYSHIQYYRQYDIMLENLEHATTAMGQVITSSLQHALLTGDRGEIQHIVDDVAEQNQIAHLAVLDKQGIIRIAPKGQTVGAYLDQDDPTCQVCHRYSPEQRKGSVILDQTGGRILRTMTPIQNRPACYGCHDASAWLNGVLLTDFSISSIDDHMATNLRDSILWSFAAMLLTIAAINVMMSRLVVTKLEQFVQTIKLFGRGRLDERVTIKSGDEIGELADAFNRMAEGLQTKEKESQQLYDELQRKEIARGHLLEKLITVQEDERQRIARDLHDHLGQALSAMTMRMQAAENIASSNPERLRERLEDAKSLALRAFEQTYEMILHLRPIALDDLGLVAAVRAYAQEHLESQGLAVECIVHGTQRRLSPHLEINLFRIAQEAMNNIAYHADAHCVKLMFEFADSQVQMCVEDDGCGFDLTTVFESKEQGRGLGLLGMKERATFAQGVCRIDSCPGAGTRVVVTIPFGEAFHDSTGTSVPKQRNGD